MYEFARVVVDSEKFMKRSMRSIDNFFFYCHIQFFFQFFKMSCRQQQLDLPFFYKIICTYFLTHAWIFFYKSRHNEKSTHRICKLQFFASVLVPLFCCAASFFRNAPEINWNKKLKRFISSWSHKLILQKKIYAQEIVDVRGGGKIDKNKFIYFTSYILYQ